MKQIAESYENKKVLVTGGAGFIGSHIVEELIKNKAKVTILDNFSSGSLNNLRNILPQINFIYGNICDPYTCLKAASKQEIVFHLAALASVQSSIKDPKTCYQTNTQGTKNMLEACIKNDIKAFVFSSSAAVYGTKEGDCNEKDKLDPLSPYAQSKVDGEELCKQYGLEHNLNTACLRYFNVYGDRQDPKGEYSAVVAKFKHNLANNKPLAIYGDGKQTRDFIHISKIVQANLKIALQENLKGEIFNIASGKSINLFELIEQLEKEMDTKKVDLLFQAARSGDVFTSKANCEKFKKLMLQ